ncbi:MAG: N-acetyldiaminopimelate deacetylase [Puniceicoccales bacterium]|jgi:N-acetyldiaminopimelate deacetylase|nr:N-acetyldiaminopimelate deacetylase [Puniceicoccales bacterium]
MDRKFLSLLVASLLVIGCTDAGKSGKDKLPAESKDKQRVELKREQTKTTKNAGLDLIKIRHDLHQIPEICFEERETSNYLYSIITGLVKGRSGVKIKRYKTGIVVYIPGTDPTKTIGWRSDMDGLPIKEETKLPFASKHKEKMHACGHDIHMAVGLGILEQILSKSQKNNFLFVFQPAEEGGGGAKALYDAGVFRKYKIDEIYAMHVSPEYDPGVIATKPGVLFAGSSSIAIEYTGKSGHAATPNKAINAILAASEFIMNVQAIVSRDLNPTKGEVLSFGTINGGTTPNVIAESVKICGNLRALTKETMELAHKRIREIAKGVSESSGAKANVLISTGSYFPGINNGEITKRFVDYVKSRDGVKFVEAPISMTAEDFGYILYHIPGMMFWLGVGGNEPLHSNKFSPDEKVIKPIVELVSEYLTNIK